MNLGVIPIEYPALDEETTIPSAHPELIADDLLPQHFDVTGNKAKGLLLRHPAEHSHIFIIMEGVDAGGEVYIHLYQGIQGMEWDFNIPIDQPDMGGLGLQKLLDTIVDPIRDRVKPVHPPLLKAAVERGSDIGFPQLNGAVLPPDT